MKAQRKEKPMAKPATKVVAKPAEKAEVSETKEACSCGCKCGDRCACGCNCGCKQRLCIIGTVIAVILSVIALCCGRCCNETKMNKAFEKYIKNNPQVILDTIDEHLQKQEEAARANPPQPQVAPQDMVQEIISDKTNMVLGNPKGKFVIIEFFDYQCGWCKKTNAEMKEALKRAPNIRWILMDAPIFGPASELIAQYALAAAEQGKFKEMHDAIGSAQGKLDEDALKELAKGLGLNVDRLAKDAHGDKVKARLEKNRGYTKTLRVGGVPMLIVDGKLNPGALIGERLEAAVKASNEK